MLNGSVVYIRTFGKVDSRLRRFLEFMYVMGLLMLNIRTEGGRKGQWSFQVYGKLISGMTRMVVDCGCWMLKVG